MPNFRRALETVVMRARAPPGPVDRGSRGFSISATVLCYEAAMVRGASGVLRGMFILFALLVACDQAGNACLEGTESCPCTAEGDCLGDLVCYSQLCVDPGTVDSTSGSGGSSRGNSTSTDGDGDDSGVPTVSGSASTSSSGNTSDPDCDPDCDGRECGPDPRCGFDCGPCPGTCSADGQCSTLGAPCNLDTQSPCKPGENCVPVTGGDRVCIPEGPIPEGEACQWAECQRGLVCVLPGPSAPYGICTPVCGRDQTCGPGSRCTSFGHCPIPCDPFTDMGCGDGMACFPLVDDYGWYATCIPEVDDPRGDLGDDCETQLDCGPGQVCIESLEDGIACHQFCDNEHPCPIGPCLNTARPDGNSHEDGGFCELCVPDCGSIECGVDPVCGIACGTCDAGDTCLDGQCCTPNCDARDCGVDPVCGTSCGSCPGGSTCRSDGTCCTPDCSARVCGEDPVCGESCGACTAPETCVDGTCECVPDCDGRSCGVDPVCGVSCGSCGSTEVCNDGQCCEPDCGGVECGSDPVCGTACPDLCVGTDVCSAGGSCVACTALGGSCDSDGECCPEAGAQIECITGSCRQCAPSGFQCNVPCCGSLVCNPGFVCNSRDCSELGQFCGSNSECCDGLICDVGADRTCQLCRGQNVECTSSSQCCDGLSCQGGGCFP